MGVKLSKFPVTAPDGTEFRISFEEFSYCLGMSLEIRLYRPRKRFGFRCIYKHTLFDSEYDRDNIDYITLASWAVSDYYDTITRVREYRREEAEAEQRRAAAAEAFAAWDGKITEVSAECSS